MGADGNKVLLPLQGKAVLAHSLACFGSMDEVSEVVVVTRDEDRATIAKLLQETIKDKPAKVVLGGDERQDSVYLGLKALSPDTKWVIIHDGARPFVTSNMVRRGLEAVKEHGAVGIAVRVKDTIKKVQEGFVVETPDRSELWAMQTPQIFDYGLVVSTTNGQKYRDYSHRRLRLGGGPGPSCAHCRGGLRQYQDHDSRRSAAIPGNVRWLRL